ncbi:MAG: GHMP kinase [Pseudomonadota bacterium]
MTTNATTKLPEATARARAPGKLILSGEHSVVYGAPAVAIAVKQYTEVWFTPMHRTRGLRTVFENLATSQFYPVDALRSFKQSLDKRFDQFVRGELPVQKILQCPDDLAIYTMTSLLSLVPVPGTSSRLKLPVPGQLGGRSDLPIGAGMGSSASIIAATSLLYEHVFDRPQTSEERFKRVRFCERLQHGNGSAIDASAVVYGGMNRIQQDTLDPIPLDETHPLMSGEGWYWVLTGKPHSTTGECVASVRETWGHDQALWDAFGTCTDTLVDTLERGLNPVDLIKENHQLLQRIGVVPERAARFIAEIEAMGGAAKVSGAGSIRGDAAGVMLVYMPDHEAMMTVMAQHRDFRWERVQIDMEGAGLSDARASRGGNTALGSKSEPLQLQDKR